MYMNKKEYYFFASITGKTKITLLENNTNINNTTTSVSKIAKLNFYHAF